MNREEFKIYAENSILDITHKIDEIRQRAYTVDEEVKNEYNEKINTLLQTRDQLQQLIEEFDTTGDNTWEDVKNEFSRGIEALQAGFEKLFNLLST